MQKERSEMVKLNKIEQFYAQEHKDTMSPAEIADVMRKNVTEETIQSYIDSLPPKVTDFFSRREDAGTVASTEGASARGDEHRDEVAETEKQIDTSVIHRIKE